MRKHFVCVRITRLNGINLNRFTFDMDVTWNAFFTDASLNIYSRYGGRDGGEPDARMSRSSLLQTMQEVLALHRTGSRAFQPVRPGHRTPRDLPLLKRNHNGCIRCHQVREYELLQAYHDGRFSRRELFRFPPPENIGMKFERAHGHRLSEVLKNSPAAAAGLKPGDMITRINDVPVRSEYDVRFALDRTRDDTPLQVVVDRRAASGTASSRQLQLKLPTAWWVTDIGWKKSMRSAPFTTGMRGYNLGPSQRKEAGITTEKLAVRISSVYEDGFARSVGLQKRDIVVGIPRTVSGIRKFEEFVGTLLGHYQPGDTVRLAVIRKGKRMMINGPFPAWFTEETTVP